MDINKILKKRTLIIAEIGNNHEGSFDLALKHIDEAKKCGVDAVKFQTFIPEKFIYKKDKKRLKQLKKFQLSFVEFKKLSIYAKKKGLIFLSTPFDFESADFLNKIQNVFKISSGDNNFYPLISKIAHFNKSIILSTGLLNYYEIKKIVKFINKIWIKLKKNKKKLILLHCVSTYPVEDNLANIKMIPFLQKNFKNNVIGYSDHTIGTTSALGSVFLGAKVIEKHFTLNNNYSSFRDHKLSLNPNNMKILVEQVRKAERIMSYFNENISREELKNIKFMRRSISVKRDIKKNEKILFKDLIWVRSTKGLLPGNEKKILNKSKKNYKKGDLL